MNKITFKIDGVECEAKNGQYIVDAARENGIYIPTLCNIVGVTPKAACRICTVRAGGGLITSCTTPVMNGMEIENNTEEIRNIRSSIIEALFVEGNHFCPACEKSGNCELQALAYRFNIMVPRFPFSFPQREIDASSPKIIKDENRCVRCKRCIKVLKDKEGRSMFAFKNRGNHIKVVIDHEVCKDITDEMAQKAMDTCPVGSIIRKEKGFDEAIGTRKFDKVPIGHEIENKELSR
jgi:[NiFe] hydrogenase diaphorase moiety small subunit